MTSCWRVGGRCGCLASCWREGEQWSCFANYWVAGGEGRSWHLNVFPVTKELRLVCLTNVYTIVLPSFHILFSLIYPAL